MSTFHYDIEAAEQEVEQTKERYLRRFGWEHTSSTPGSFWLWRRDFADVDAKRMEFDKLPPGPLGKPSPTVPYGVITASTDIAVAMTVRCLDDQNELNEEESAA